MYRIEVHTFRSKRLRMYKRIACNTLRIIITIIYEVKSKYVLNFNYFLDKLKLFKLIYSTF